MESRKYNKEMKIRKKRSRLTDVENKLVVISGEGRTGYIEVREWEGGEGRLYRGEGVGSTNYWV